MYEKSNEELQ